MSKFDMALEIIKNPNYEGKLNFGQLQKLPRKELELLYDKYKSR